MMNELTVEEKLRFVRFMCAFAWADLDIADRERGLIRDLIQRLDLPASAVEEAEGWLVHPPLEEDLDPYDIPDAHRRIFLQAATELIGVDGHVDRMEVENLALFEMLMGLDIDDEE
jgi:uncharacterized membrane protein YebE (DUF533 family)